MARYAAAIALVLLPASLAAEGSLRSTSNIASLQHAAEDLSQSLAVHMGCWKDTSNDRIMENVMVDDNLTLDKCEAHCSGYPYYGVQYGSQCYCGKYDTNYWKHGNENIECEMPCAGDSDETCGDGYAMNVYMISQTDLDSIACVKDTGNDRVFTDSWADKDGMTPSRCKTYCETRGYSFYGTQYGQECWCGAAGADYDKHGKGECNRPCSGDPDKFCGGRYYSMTVYAIAQTDPASIACVKDTGDRVFTNQWVDTTNMQSWRCYNHCRKYDSAYFGTQYGTECWCGASGTVYDKYGGATCDMACSGDDQMFCGGRYAMTVYQYYIEGSGANSNRCYTLTNLYNERDGKPPLYVSDADGNEMGLGASPTGYWLLKGELYVTDGAILYIHGTSAGGDCNILRIQSEDPPLFHEVRGYGGSLSFESTKVISWDTTTKSVRETYEGGRACINCVSEILDSETCTGRAKNDKGECRMDIIDSEIGYLGYPESESYGLTWKVRGFCADKTNPEVFDTTNVYGDIKYSDIHHNYFGMYSYGHQGGVWTRNHMHHNHQYGFDPHDDSDFLTISYNEVYDNGNHGIIASKRCNHVKIHNNVVKDGGANAAGIFLHRSSDSAEVYDNHVFNMFDAGIANLESYDSKVYGNWIENTKYGIRISLGGSNNEVYGNRFKNPSKYALYTYTGSDTPDVSPDGRPTNNIFYDNVVTCTTGNGAAGVKFKDADLTQAYENTFARCDELEFQDARNTWWTQNTVSDACTSIVGTATFTIDDSLPTAC